MGERLSTADVAIPFPRILVGGTNPPIDDVDDAFTPEQY